MTKPVLIWKQFDQLTTHELYALLKLRTDVFVVEQNCAYEELDNQDQNAHHLLVTQENELIGYSRVLHEKGHLHIGRIVTNLTTRKTGLGKAIIIESIRYCKVNFPNEEIHISAQARLETYYHSFGFKTISAAYDWDGIPHVDMVLK